MAIAFAAAIFAYKQTWFETPFSLFSAFLYGVPAIALFELLVQVTGINRFTAEIGLVSYTLLILFRNMLAGLRGVPDATIATLATFAGGGGLGDIVVNEPTYGTGGVIAGSLWIIVLIFAIDGLLALVQLRLTPTPLRRPTSRARAAAQAATWWTG
jgi:ABC-type proline/glycine betaine transport system permease subunit